MPHRAVAVANEFLRLPGATEQLTQMHAQKLAYFAHGWNWALNDEPLISEQAQAWSYGPVYPDLYDHTKFFGREPMGRLITPDDSEVARFFGRKLVRNNPPYAANMTERERQIIRHCWSRYGGLSAIRLSELTHQPGTPWYEAYRRGKNTPLDEETIRRHYVGIANRTAAARNAGA
jgi:uncharacterized phage-associated protein